MRLSIPCAFCGPNARSSTSRANSIPPAAMESAASMTSSHSASTASVASLLTRSIRAISNEICSTSSAASFCVMCDAASEPSTMQRIATFCVPVSCSSWWARAREFATGSVLQPRADDARRDFRLLLDGRAHAVAHRVRRHHDGHRRSGAQTLMAVATVGALQRDRWLSSCGRAAALERLEADERYHDDQDETENTEQRALHVLHHVDDVGLRLLDRCDDDRREGNADDGDDIAARAVR